MKRLLAGTVLLFVSACQCADVPVTLCFADEPCGRASDAGVDGGSDGGPPLDAGEDAGVDGGPDAGVDAGSDAGTDAGVDAGDDAGLDAGDAGEVDAGIAICDSWQCVRAQLQAPPLTAPPGFSVVRLPFTGVTGVGPACLQQYRGGILMPDGRVLAIPNCAKQFLVIDPVAQTALQVGAISSLLDAGTLESGFGGAVLGCDGRIWVLPSENNTLFAVSTKVDGGFRYGGATLNTFPVPFGAQGGVVNGPCDAGFEIWTTPRDARIRLTISPTQIGHFNTTPPPTGLSTPFVSRGLLRLPDDEVFITAPTILGARVWSWRLAFGTSALADVFLSDAGTFYGAALGASGRAYYVDPDGGTVWAYDNAADTLEIRFGFSDPSQTGFKWPAFRGDGFIYALGQSLLAIEERPNGGLFQLLAPELADAGAQLADPFSGLVVTPSGTMVAIPSEFPDVLLLVPDGGATAPPAVLLSPWFNKL